MTASPAPPHTTQPEGAGRPRARPTSSRGRRPAGTRRLTPSSLAHEYPLSVSTQDLSFPEGRDLAERVGLLFPPGLLLDGGAYSYGRVSERKLRRELEKRLGR